MKWIRENKKINELYDMFLKGDLQLQPFFQRNLVWTTKAKSQFIESILLNIPISEVYLYEDELGMLSVIDGQQRLSTIFHFLKADFMLINLEKYQEISEQDTKQKVKNFIMYYVKIDKNVSREEIIDTYSRINKYTVTLNDQELRRAMYYNSKFLELSEKLAESEFFVYARFFTERKRERMNDVEYISELLACQLDGIQDKKHKLDSFYENYSNMCDDDMQESRFMFIIEQIESIFNFPNYFINDKIKYNGESPSKNIGSTRYRQQADFYSIFYLMLELQDKKIELSDIQKEQFLKLLLIYDHLIEPEADIEILSTYAVKCISQGNTKNSRNFRYQFLSQSIDYVIDKTEGKFILSFINDLKEVFEYSLSLDDLDINDFKNMIDKFYEDIE